MRISDKMLLVFHEHPVPLGRAPNFQQSKAIEIKKAVIVYSIQELQQVLVINYNIAMDLPTIYLFTNM